MITTSAKMISAYLIHGFIVVTGGRAISSGTLSPVSQTRNSAKELAGQLFAVTAGSSGLTQFFHHLLEHFPARTHRGFRQRSQRLVGHVEQINEGWRLGVDI